MLDDAERRLRERFAAYLSEKETQLVAADQWPFGASSFSASTTAAVWRTVPS
ncbi:hypothetical protein RB199_14270 [Streptomyces libani]|uniref:hypothetical protein n=1 Tax=Streptomyces nigrescens TaxID=1920 RepID=UPI003025076F